MTLEELLIDEATCRRRLNESQRMRRQVEEECAGLLAELNAIKRLAYQMGFKGNIMRDADGNRVTELAEPDCKHGPWTTTYMGSSCDTCGFFTED